MTQKLLEQKETKFRKFIRTKGIYIAMTCTFVGLFIGIPALIWFSNLIMIGVGKLFLLIFIFGTIGLLQWNFFKKHIDIEYHEFVMYCFAGFGMCTLNIALILNFNVIISSHTEIYQIKKIRKTDHSFQVVLQGSDGTSVLEKKVSECLTENYKTLPQEKIVKITFDKGLLGIEIIANCEL